MKIQLGAALVLAISLFANAGAAHSYQQGDIHIGHVWMNEPADQATTAQVYMPFVNNGKDSDSLVGASTNIAKKIEFRRAIRHEDKPDEIKTETVSKIDVPAGAPVSLSRHGSYLFLTGLTKPLKAGDTFPLTLNFAKAGAAQVDVMVERPDVMGKAPLHQPN